MGITSQTLEQNKIDFEIGRTEGNLTDFDVHFSNGKSSFMYKFIDDDENGTEIAEILRALNKDATAVSEFSTEFGIK